VEQLTESIEIRRQVEGTQGREWDILIIKPGLSKNGVLYEPAVLKAAAPLYEGAISYDKHGDGGARSFKERIGRIHSVSYDTREGDEALWGRLRVIDPGVREKLLEAVEAGELHTVGFSHDVMAEQEQAQYQGRRVRKARRIESVNSVDMVERPSAGGRMSRLVAGDVEAEMDADEIKQLVAESVATSVKEAMAGATVEIAKVFTESVKPKTHSQEQPTEITATTIQTGSDAGSSLSKELKEATEAANAALREATKQRQRNELTRQIETTKLSELGKTFLRKQFEEAIDRRELEDTEIAAMVATEVEREAILSQGAANPNVPNAIRFEAGTAGREKFVKDLSAMFAPPSEKLEEGVKPFTTFKEAYIKFTGNWDVDYYRMMEDYLPKGGYISSRDHTRITESITTATWADIYADVMYQQLIKAYVNAPWYDQWRLFVSSIENVPDFRTRHWMRIGGYGNLPAVPEGGTYQSTTSPGDEEVEYAVTKRGFLDDITMEAIANDQVNVVTRMVREMGRSAARTLYNFVLDMITTDNPTMPYDSVTLYDNAHSNTGTTALSVSGLNTTQIAMGDQTAFGQSLEILGDRNRIKYLIVPSELAARADRIVNPSDAYQAHVSADTDTLVDPHMFKGSGIVVHTYHKLTDATDWFAVADPNQVETVVMGFLGGRQEPEFFTQDQPQNGSVFTADKLSWKIRHVYGGASAEHRSFYRQVVGG